MAAFSTQAVVAALLISTAVCVPTVTHIGLPSSDATLSGSGRASLKQVRNPGYRFIGALSVKKTYLKYGKEVPDWLEAAVANLTADLDIFERSTGSASTTPSDIYDSAYVTPVSIGTPAQVLNLDVDSASSDAWAFSTLTQASQVNGQTLYDPSKSSTAKLLSGETWSTSYADGSSSSGIVYTDVCTVGGLTVTNQAIQVAKRVSSLFTSDSAVDGIMGLGFDSVNTVSPDPQTTFFSNALPSLDAPVYTADLSYHSPGTYNFGFINSTAYTGSITYTSVSSARGYWDFTSTGYAVGSGSFKSTSISGVADTGTSLLYLPSTIVKAYYAQVPGSSDSTTEGGYIFPCGTTLPSFTFGIGSARFTIPATYLDYGAVRTGSSSCFGGLQSSDYIGDNIFGDVALKAAFVVFDGSPSPRLGWASK